MIESAIGKRSLLKVKTKILNGGCCAMTKLNNEVIVAIAGAYEKIGQAHLEIAEYLKTLANGFPSIDEVEVTKDEVEAPVEVEEDVEEVSEDVVEEVEEDGDEAEEFADDEEEVVEEEERSTIITVETEDGEEEIDLDEMSVKELKQFAEEYGLEVKAKTKKGIIEEILEQIYGEDEEVEDDVEEVEEDVEEVDEDSEDDGESEEDLAEMYGLNEMSLEELAEICAEYGLSTKGKRQALIDRIVRGIKDGTIEVGDEEEGE